MPKCDGGLGLRSLKQVNIALLGKWLWRLGKENQRLWYKVVEAKYGISRGGCDVLGPQYQFSGMWKEIVSVEDRFKPHIRYRVVSGVRISFWYGIWIRDCSFAEQFPDLFRCTRDSRRGCKPHVLRTEFHPSEELFLMLRRPNFCTSWSC